MDRRLSRNKTSCFHSNQAAIRWKFSEWWLYDVRYSSLCIMYIYVYAETCIYCTCIDFSIYRYVHAVQYMYSIYINIYIFGWEFEFVILRRQKHANRPVPTDGTQLKKAAAFWHLQIERQREIQENEKNKKINIMKLV